MSQLLAGTTRSTITGDVIRVNGTGDVVLGYAQTKAPTPRLRDTPTAAPRRQASQDTADLLAPVNETDYAAVRKRIGKLSGLLADAYKSGKATSPAKKRRDQHNATKKRRAAQGDPDADNG